MVIFTESRITSSPVRNPLNHKINHKKTRKRFLPHLELTRIWVRLTRVLRLQLPARAMIMVSVDTVTAMITVDTVIATIMVGMGTATITVDMVIAMIRRSTIPHLDLFQFLWNSRPLDSTVLLAPL